MPHLVYYQGSTNSERWIWNGDEDKPTLQPSIKVTWDDWDPPAVYGQPLPKEQKRISKCCHSFVTNGTIRFLEDCTHSLANQTLQLPDWEIRRVAIQDGDEE